LNPLRVATVGTSWKPSPLPATWFRPSCFFLPSQEWPVEASRSHSPGKPDHSAQGKDEEAVMNAATSTRFTLQTWRTLGRDAHSIEGDPRFLAPAAGNYRLEPGSPARGAGTVLADVPSDLDGQARPRNAPPDIGAYQESPGN